MSVHSPLVKPYPRPRSLFGRNPLYFLSTTPMISPFYFFFPVLLFLFFRKSTLNLTEGSNLNT